MAESEQRADLFHVDDADTVVVACNTPARMAKGAVEALRKEGARIGLYRPITLWPFPMRQLQPHLGHIRRFVVVEASEGQLEDELRLALSRSGIYHLPQIEGVRHMGGVLPQLQEIIERVCACEEVPV